MIAKANQKALATFVEHDCSVEWFCEMQHVPHLSSTQFVCKLWEQKLKTILAAFVDHDCSVEWFCKMQQPPQQSSTQLVSSSWEQKQTPTHCQHWLSMIALVNGFVKYSKHHSSPLHNLFLTQESKSKPKNISNICWAWLLCWTVLWNATYTTAFLYTISF